MSPRSSAVFLSFFTRSVSSSSTIKSLISRLKAQQIWSHKPVDTVVNRNLRRVCVRPSYSFLPGTKNG